MPLAFKINIVVTLLFLLCNQGFAQQQEQINIRLARPTIINTPKNQYIHSLLTQSLEKVGKEAHFIYSVTPMNNKRVVEQLPKKGGVDLVWLSINPASHPDLLHTTIPIYKGLQGKRLLIINKNQQQRFANIQSLNDLKPLIGLQKQSWWDYEVLKRNGLTVNGELSYNNMFKAIHSGLADYFPRSISAIEAEITKQQHLNLMIEPNIMLKYPSHYVFYAHKRNKRLIALLEEGLIKMQQSGDFEKLYLKFYGNIEERLQLSTKNVFTLN